jgi:hypothetical protein
MLRGIDRYEHAKDIFQPYEGRSLKEMMKVPLLLTCKLSIC